MSSYIALESLEVAKPCRASWAGMKGDDRTRFCATCQKSVYNLTGMTRAEAEELVRSQEGEICIRFKRRADGTVITNDCPVGVTAQSQTPGWTRAALLLLLAPLLVIAGPHFGEGSDLGAQSRQAGGSSLSNGSAGNTGLLHCRLRDFQPFKAIYDCIDPEHTVMGGANTTSLVTTTT